MAATAPPFASRHSPSSLSPCSPSSSSFRAASIPTKQAGASRSSPTHLRVHLSVFCSPPCSLPPPALKLANDPSFLLSSSLMPSPPRYTERLGSSQHSFRNSTTSLILKSVRAFGSRPAPRRATQTRLFSSTTTPRTSSHSLANSSSAPGLTQEKVCIRTYFAFPK